MKIGYAAPLIISVKEMRKLLGNDGARLTDEQVADLIITLTDASSRLLNSAPVPKNQ
jgi:Ca2+-binding EF-hand superfamily protein